jgi:iron(III) transport system substrate-binding protein
MSIRRLSRILATVLLGVSFAALAQKTPLTVYTALETDQLKAYKEAFEKSNPTVEINWVRDSTGVITARLLAEKANPRADVVMGVAASSLAVLDNGHAHRCAPLAWRASAQYRDAVPPAWSAWTPRHHGVLQHRRGRQAHVPGR